jgi:hypothetical protein
MSLAGKMHVHHVYGNTVPLGVAWPSRRGGPGDEIIQEWCEHAEYSMVESCAARPECGCCTRGQGGLVYQGKVMI